MRMVCGSLIIR